MGFCEKNEKEIKGLMLEKDPGLSWVKFLNDICVFSSGDPSHPRIDDEMSCNSI